MHSSHSARCFRSPLLPFAATAAPARLELCFTVPTAAPPLHTRRFGAGHTILRMIVPAGKPGARQTISLPGARQKRLIPDHSTVTVGAGSVPTQLRSPIIRGSVLVR